MTVDRPDDALPCRLAGLRRRGEHQAPLLGAVDEPLGEGVHRVLVERRREPEQLVLGHRARRDDPLDLGLAARDGPGLVEQDRAGAAERLDRPAALDDDPLPRRARETRDERDRGCQDQRARRRDDEHGERTHGVARERPGEPRDGCGHGQEDDRVAVGHADERRPLLGRAPHEPHDAGVGRLARLADHAQVEGLAGVGGSREDLAVGRDRDWERLPGQRGRVDHRLMRAGHHAVGGDHLTRPDHEHVPGDEVVDGNLDDRVPSRRWPMRGARSTSARSSRVAMPCA